MSDKPIAVFDSGLGGLSVVRHLRHRLPHEQLVYFGDTARVPYGSKSRQTVITFALEAARFLLQRTQTDHRGLQRRWLAGHERVRSATVPVIGGRTGAATAWPGRRAHRRHRHRSHGERRLLPGGRAPLPSGGHSTHARCWWLVEEDASRPTASSPHSAGVPYTASGTGHSRANPGLHALSAA